MRGGKKALSILVIASFLFAVLLAVCVNARVEAAGGDWYFDENGFWYCYYDNTYPYSQWLEIDGSWYYFDERGYITFNEWRGGYWIGDDATCTYEGIGSWKCDSTGWWFEDSFGWWPSNEWQKIDGKWYYFEATGYMAHEKYVDGYWLGSDGAWTDPPESDEDKKDKEEEEWGKKKVNKAQVTEVNTSEKWAKILLTSGETYLAKNLELNDKVKADFYPGFTDEQILKAEAYAEYMANDIKSQKLKTDKEKLEYVCLYTELWIAFSQNDKERQGDSIADTPYGFFVDNAFNEKGAIKGEERILHYVGYDDYTETTLSDGKVCLDVKVSDGIIRVNFYTGTAEYL